MKLKKRTEEIGLKEKTGTRFLFKMIVPSILLLFLYYIVGNVAFFYVFIAYSLAVVAFLDYDNSAVYLVALSPFSAIIRMHGSGVNLYFLMTLTFCLSALLFKKAKMNVKALASFVIFVIYCLITYDLSILGREVSSIITLLNYFCLLLLVSNHRANQQFLTDSFSISFVTAGIFALFINQLPFLNAVLRSASIYNGSVLISRFSGLAYDTNFYALGVLTLISLYLPQCQIKGRKRWAFSMLFILSVFGFATLSKMFVLGYFLVLFLFLLSQKQLYAKLKTVIGISLILILIYYILKQIDGGLVIQTILNRFKIASNLDAFTTHRSTLWGKYTQEILSHTQILFFGSGLNHELLDGWAAHNTYIQVLYMFGVIGATILLSFIFELIAFYKKQRRKPLFVQWTPLIILAFCLFGLSAFSYDIIHIYLFLVVIVLQGGEPVDNHRHRTDIQ